MANCFKCDDKKITRSSDGDGWVLCQCEMRANIQRQLEVYGPVKFIKPVEILEISNTAFIKTTFPIFKDYLAGYLMLNYEIYYKYMTIQEFFSEKMEYTHIEGLMLPDLLIVDFVGLVQNRGIPLFVNQVVEERSQLKDKKTWFISQRNKSDLYAQFPNNREFLEKAFQNLPEFIFSSLGAKKKLTSKSKGPVNLYNRNKGNT